MSLSLAWDSITEAKILESQERMWLVGWLNDKWTIGGWTETIFGLDSSADCHLSFNQPPSYNHILHVLLNNDSNQTRIQEMQDVEDDSIKLNRLLQKQDFFLAEYNWICEKQNAHVA